MGGGSIEITDKTRSVLKRFQGNYVRKFPQAASSNEKTAHKLHLKGFLKASPKWPQYREIRICRVFFANWVRIGSIGPKQIIFEIWEVWIKVHP